MHEEGKTIFNATVLNTGLYPTFGVKTENYGSGNLEGFMAALEGTLLKEAFRCQRF